MSGELYTKIRIFLESHFSGKVLTQVANIITFPLSACLRLTRYSNLIVRRGTSDVTVFRKIFIYKDYDIDYPLSPKLIIDGGANVGYASVFFANKFPDAEIVAVEPEMSNYRILVHNVSQFQRVLPIQKGLWNKKGFLEIIDSSSEKFAFMTREVSAQDNYDVEVITINDILELTGHSEIDILKLDIEGAEKELFSSNFNSWLGKVNILIIELHDHMKPGCANALYSAINNYDFESEVVGENLVLRKLS